MEYIVLDLEWNQSNTGQEAAVPGMPFEIIEIGAVKLNDECVMIGEFSNLIKPVVYREMHQITSRLIHLQMQELERGKPFPEVAGEFLGWCGKEDFLFCTWGSSDLTELQRNMRYHNMTPVSDVPFAYLDVQKLFSLAFEDGKSRRSLEYAVDMLAIEKDIPFHRAFSDAYYTAKVLKLVREKRPEVMKKTSYDLFHLPQNRKQEIKMQYDTYMKYISRVFDNKTEAFQDKEVVSSTYYFCHKNLRKKIRWFSPNGKHYYCLAWCDKHGYLKGKIRVRKAENGQIYIVKTTKLISGDEAELIRERHDQVKEIKKNGKGERDL